ncbi:12763_t:CDS:2, partial [Funneliformis geosporum]
MNNASDDVKYQGLIEDITTKEELEEQLCYFIHSIKKQDGTEYHASSVNNCLHAINRHLNEKSTLPKPINILNKNKYYKLWQIFNGKVKNLANKGLAEHTGSSGLHGGEHFNLQYNSFLRKNDGYRGFEIILYKSKTNQHGVDNIESQ